MTGRGRGYAVLSLAWHSSFSAHSPHFALRAWHRARPCRITSCEKRIYLGFPV